MNMSASNTCKSADFIRDHAMESGISLLLISYYEKTASLSGFSKMQRQLQYSVD